MHAFARSSQKAKVNSCAGTSPGRSMHFESQNRRIAQGAVTFVTFLDSSIEISLHYCRAWQLMTG